MLLADQGKVIPFLVEDMAYEGVRRIVYKVGKDVERVFGTMPQIINSLARVRSCPEAGGGEKEERYRQERPVNLVLCATLGKSELLKALIREGKLEAEQIEGKWEAYIIRLIKNPFPDVDEALVICGSDKRGTIYGIFGLSEYIGVSPLHFWGDVEPVRRNRLAVGTDIQRVSGEPSVKYRGFFINDEWPCFGNWTFSHFGGFTAEMYEHVFELLLRLKGNYLWPAMWTSSFPLDGPGDLNERLADMYGVVIGYSHHEPCLRASEEWDLVRGEDSVYGNDWNFYTNEEGLTRYWRDGLKRSGKYEHLITLGMRGERDSSILGPEAALKQNIELLKNVITIQRKLIREQVNPDISRVPQVLALYKEVEPYFYGDENTPGLKDWEELSHVICMLCEDNFGYMRTLPSPELLEQLKKRGCGFGMYYHLDYHGGPVSYEWILSTPLSLIWEQMCKAYDFGIRDAWIVNVGDLKGNEVALSYFLALAYDFDTWGSGFPNSWEEYIRQWLMRTFPDIDEPVRQKMGRVFKDYVAMNHKRRPEALHEGIYHPCHFLETDNMLAWAEAVERDNKWILEETKKEDEKSAEAYYSMIGYPAGAAVNLLRMHLYAGKNRHYALQGRPVANKYADLVTECIRRDRELGEEFALFRNGKWKGMEQEQHIGFVSWNEDNCRYPVRMQVEPAYKPRMTVSRKDAEEIAFKSYFQPMKILVDDFMYAGCDEVILEIANDGRGELSYEITGGAQWLGVTPVRGIVSDIQEVRLSCDRMRLPGERKPDRVFGEETYSAVLKISDSETTVLVEVRARQISELTGVFLPVRDVIVMDAHHYAEKHDTGRGRFVELTGYGKYGYGMKVLPSTAAFAETEDAPSLTYRFYVEKEGEYRAEVLTAPANPAVYGESIHFLMGVRSHDTEPQNEKKQVVNLLAEDYSAGDPSCEEWCRGVLDQVRRTQAVIYCQKGIMELTISAMDPGLVPERILIYPVQQKLPESYLGPAESCFLK